MTTTGYPVAAPVSAPLITPTGMIPTTGMVGAAPMWGAATPLAPQPAQTWSNNPFMSTPTMMPTSGIMGAQPGFNMVNDKHAYFNLFISYNFKLFFSSRLRLNHKYAHQCNHKLDQQQQFHHQIHLIFKVKNNNNIKQKNILKINLFIYFYFILFFSLHFLIK